MAQEKVPFRKQYLGKAVYSAFYGVVIKVDQYITTENYVNGLFIHNLVQLKKISLGETRYLGEDFLYLHALITFSEIAIDIMGRRRLKCPPDVNAVSGSLDNLWININPEYFNIPIPKKTA